MSSSEDRLREISEMRRAGSDGGRRGVLLVLAGALFVAAVAAAGWFSLAGLPAAREGAASSLVDRAMRWYLERGAMDLEPVGVDDTPVAFEIGDGESLQSVADRLQAQGLVRDGESFRMLARVEGLDTGIQAGMHILRASMTAEEVLRELQVGAADSVTVTLLEGWRIEEMADAMAAAGVADRDEVVGLARAGGAGAESGSIGRASARPHVSERPAGASLEGYLFPDTYQLEPDAGAEAVISRLLDTFEARIAGELPGVGPASTMTTHEIVTVASIVEREAAVDDERGMIARVFLNRLETPPSFLNADPTVQYALGFQPESETWWKRPLLEADLGVDSPYNTYVSPGLPPGPIASPGLESLRAVLDPPEGDWQYFVANDVACDGTHVFAVTLDEHIANIANYQTGDCGG
ncbi:MAG: endolytic transglycosylase MltG [Anaerolineae bacterium]|jgi:UPF0755 protein